MLELHSMMILARIFFVACFTLTSGFQASTYGRHLHHSTPRVITATRLYDSPLSLDNSLTTVIALYPTQDVSQQQGLALVLESSILPLIQQQEGFVSAQLHTSLDGTKVGLYKQWASPEAYAKHVADEAIQMTIQSLWQAAGISPNQVDSHVYEIVTFASNLPANEPIILSQQHYPLVHFAEFRMPPENQPRMIELAQQHIHPAMQIPGLLTATFHRSLDGWRVINYGQWANEEAIDNLKQQPGFSSDQPYWEGVAENEHHLYKLVASFE